MDGSRIKYVKCRIFRQLFAAPNRRRHQLQNRLLNQPILQVYDRHWHPQTLLLQHPQTLLPQHPQMLLPQHPQSRLLLPASKRYAATDNTSTFHDTSCTFHKTHSCTHIKTELPFHGNGTVICNQVNKQYCKWNSYCAHSRCFPGRVIFCSGVLSTRVR